MQRKIIDWKDVAQGFYQKALSLAILLILFAFLVSPKMKVKAYEHKVKESKVIDIPPEIKKKIKPPERTVKPTVEIVIEESGIETEDEDIEIAETIEKTTFDPLEEQAPPSFRKTPPKFKSYEEEPVPIRQIPPKYPAYAKKMGIEGTVVLNVVVYKDGTVGEIEVVQSLLPGPGGLDEAAIKAVKKWEFSPAKSGGNPVSVWVNIPIEFSLE